MSDELDFKKMTASQTIYALTHELVDGRCYPLYAPEHDEFGTPYIIYHIISTNPDNTLDGITGHEWVNVQIDVYSDDYDELVTLSNLVMRKMNAVKPSEYGGVRYLYDDKLYRAIVEYGFWQACQG